MSLILYAYCNPDNQPLSIECGTLPGTPFYIGIGKPGRQLDHLKLAKSKKQDTVNPRKTQHIRHLIECNTLPHITVLKEGLMLEDAKRLEKSTIAEIGTESEVKHVEKRGTLLNLHCGGGGGVGSKKPKSRETRRKMSEAKRGWKPTPEHRAAFIAGGANRVRSAEENKRRGESISRSLQSRSAEEVAAVMNKRRAKGWISDEARAKRALQVENGELKHSTKTKKKISKIVTAVMAQEDVKQKMRDGAERRWSDSAERQKVADRNSKTYQLTHRETGEVLVIKNMQAFCRQTGSHPRKVWKQYVVERQ